MPDASQTIAHKRGQLITDAIIFALPLLVTVALYLPSGLFMPVRLATLALGCVAAWQLVSRRGLAAPRVFWSTVGIVSVFALFGSIAIVRYREQTSLSEAVQFGFIALTCLTFAVLVRERRTVLALVYGWLASGVMAAVVGVWEVVTARHLPGNSPAQQYGHLPGWNEISSFFDNPNLYAYHCALLLLMLPIAWYAWRSPWRWGVLPLGLVILVMLERTNGRMALMAVVVGGFIWCLRYRWTRLVALAAIVLTAITMALSLPPGHTLYRFVYVALDGLQWEGKSTWVRAQMAKSGWWMMEQSQFLGVGPGGYAIRAFDPDNPYTYQSLNNAHWGMVEVGADYGAVSLIVLLVSFVAAAVYAVRVAKLLRGRNGASAALDRTIALAGAILTVTVPIISISHSTWLRQPMTAVHLGTLVALLSWAEICRRRLSEWL